MWQRSTQKRGEPRSPQPLTRVPELNDCSPSACSLSLCPPRLPPKPHPISERQVLSPVLCPKVKSSPREGALGEGTVSAPFTGGRHGERPARPLTARPPTSDPETPGRAGGVRTQIRVCPRQGPTSLTTVLPRRSRTLRSYMVSAPLPKDHPQVFSLPALGLLSSQLHLWV